LEAWGVAKFCDEVCKPGIKDSSVLWFTDSTTLLPDEWVPEPQGWTRTLAQMSFPMAFSDQLSMAFFGTRADHRARTSTMYIQFVRSFCMHTYACTDIRILMAMYVLH
jgi:hypothetical protein